MKRGVTKKVKRAVVLVSGGMDSTTLLHYLSKREKVTEIHALSFLYGQKHSRELAMAGKQIRKAGVKVHKVIDISVFKQLTTGSALTDPARAVPEFADVSAVQRKQPPTYVPNRNMVFLSLAAAYAESVGIDRVYYGAQQQDEYGYWDCSVDFLERINHLLRLNRGKAVKIIAPFVGLRKVDLLKLGMKLGIDYSETWTCYRGGRRPCGNCPSCVERKKAFAEIGVDDPCR